MKDYVKKVRNGTKIIFIILLSFCLIASFLGCSAKSKEITEDSVILDNKTEISIEDIFVLVISLEMTSGLTFFKS